MYGPAKPDHPLVRGFDVAPEGEVRRDVVALGEERDRGEEEDEQQVDGNEDDRLLQRPGIAVRPEVVPEPDQREQHRGARATPRSDPAPEQVHECRSANSTTPIAHARRLPRLSPRAIPMIPSPIATLMISPAERSSPCTKVKWPSEKRIEVAVGKQGEDRHEDCRPGQSSAECLGRRVTAADADRSPERCPRA